MSEDISGPQHKLDKFNGPAILLLLLSHLDEIPIEPELLAEFVDVAADVCMYTGSVLTFVSIIFAAALLLKAQYFDVEDGVYDERMVRLSKYQSIMATFQVVMLGLNAF